MKKTLSRVGDAQHQSPVVRDQHPNALKVYYDSFRSDEYGPGKDANNDVLVNQLQQEGVVSSSEQMRVQCRHELAAVAFISCRHQSSMAQTTTGMMFTR